MFGSEFYGYALWWIFPLVLVILCIFLCGFIIMGRKGSMPCRPGFRSTGSSHEVTSGPALNTINERCARGEINKAAHEQKKVVTQHN